MRDYKPVYHEIANNGDGDKLSSPEKQSLS